MTITEREHADLVGRVERNENRLDKVEDRVDRLEGRFDKVDGMMTMLRLIFGASVIGAVAGVIALIEIIAHASGNG